MNSKIDVGGVLLVMILTALVVGSGMLCPSPTLLVGIEPTTNPPIPILIEAMIQVESNDKLDAIGDSGEVGCLQITDICLRDVNRILGEEKYLPEDRYTRQKSIDMCVIYMSHYMTVAVRRHEAKDCAETMARIWNGGPNGWSKPETIKYWNKVKKELQ